MSDTHRDNLKKLADLVESHSEQLMSSWRAGVRKLPTAGKLDAPTLNDHIPDVLQELARALWQGHTASVMKAVVDDTPKTHGLARLQAGFDIVEVVAEYNILRESIFSLAEEAGLDITADATKVVNRITDRAIAIAVDTYARQKAVELQRRREEHLSFLLHDLKTPLQALAVAGVVLGSTIPESAKTPNTTRMLDLLQRNSRRLNALMKDATQAQLNMAASGKVELTVAWRDFDLWPIVQNLVEDLRPLSDDAGSEIVNETPVDFVVTADPVLLTQAIQNLLSNAVKFTKDGKIRIGAAANAEGFKCWVEDTGEGIAPSRLDRIFDRLETDPGRAGGLGRGLAIVQEIVHAHGGDVGVESGLGKGSRFTLTIPASSRAESP